MTKPHCKHETINQTYLVRRRNGMVTKFNLMKKMNNTNTKNKIIYNYKIATKEGHSK